MKRLLVAARANSKQWVELFRDEVPNHEILDEIPAFGDALVAYVVVGRPPPGLIVRLPGLEVVLSLNAGVEHLLAGGEVPGHIPMAANIREYERGEPLLHVLDRARGY